MARKVQEVNAGSMADIAFTLLIFFLVSTTLSSDKGERVLLPPWNDNLTQDEEKTPVTARNVLAVDVLNDGSLSVEGNIFPYDQLKNETITFLMNNGKNPEYSDSYEKAVVNLRTDPKAPYKGYVEAYSNIKAAFNQIRDDYSMSKYQKPYDKLTDQEKEARDDVRNKYPLKLAEKMIDEDDLK